MEDAGVLPGLDMTPEAALTKLTYVLAKEDWDYEEKKKVSNFSFQFLNPAFVNKYLMLSKHINLIFSTFWNCRC